MLILDGLDDLVDLGLVGPGIVLETCFRWLAEPFRCAGRRLAALSWTPQVGVQGDTDKGVEADSEIVCSSPGGGVKECGKS